MRSSDSWTKDGVAGEMKPPAGRAYLGILLAGLVMQLPVTAPAAAALSISPRIRGGTTTLTGAYEAVVQVRTGSGFCSGTLIAPDAVLTAAHCVCTGCAFPNPNVTCQSRSTVTFTNVLPVGSSTRTNVSINADVIVYPRYCGGWLTNDYAILRLDQPAAEKVRVSPMYVEDASRRPQVNDEITLIGYGGTNQGGTNNCNQGAVGTKRSGDTLLDDYYVYPDRSQGATLVFNDMAVGACPGDSGGPAVNARGRVVGVCSHGDNSTNSNYDPTNLVWSWISDNACPEMDRSSPDAGFCNNPLCPCVSGEGDCDYNSHCVSGAECVHDIGTSTGLPKEYDVCYDTLDVVRLYDGSRWDGVSQAFPVGNWDVRTMYRVGNDRVSSLSVPAGLTARLCSENGGWGDCQDFSGVRSLAGSVLDNRTSNVQVFPGVTVYDYTYYRGASQTFKVGFYDVRRFTTIDNDDITSLIASPGIKVRLCSESGGWGDCQDFSGEVSYVGALLNQRTSNIEVRPGVTVYAGRNYTGTSQAFSQGTYNHTDLTVIGNDRVRSLVVAPGMKVRLCSESGGWGDCEEFTGWVPYVGRVLDRRTSTIDVMRD